MKCPSGAVRRVVLTTTYGVWGNTKEPIWPSIVPLKMSAKQNSMQLAIYDIELLHNRFLCDTCGNVEYFNSK